MSVFSGATVFSVGTVIRDHTGSFLKSKNLAHPSPSSVFEAECIGMREALSWVMNRGERNVIVETDSILTISTIHGKNENMLEVVHTNDQHKVMLRSLSEVCVTHVQN